MKKKKGDPIPIRFPERLERAIKDLADSHNRSFQQEVAWLLAKSVHNEKFNMREYL